MSSKISPKHIVRDHLSTFTNYSTGSLSLSDVAVQIALPLLLGVGWFIARPRMSETFVSTVLDATAIMSALLLNLQVLLIGVVDRIADHSTVAVAPDTDELIRRRLLRETNANVSYAILTCIILIVSLLATSLPEYSRLLVDIGTTFVYSTITHFIMTLLLILQRVHVSLKKQIDRLLTHD